MVNMRVFNVVFFVRVCEYVLFVVKNFVWYLLIFVICNRIIVVFVRSGVLVLVVIIVSM